MLYTSSALLKQEKYNTVRFKKGAKNERNVVVFFGGGMVGFARGFPIYLADTSSVVGPKGGMWVCLPSFLPSVDTAKKSGVGAV